MRFLIAVIVGLSFALPTVPVAAATPRTAIIFLSGYTSSSEGGASHLSRFDPLRQRLFARGIPDADIFDFSYTGYAWTPDGWMARPYTSDDTLQSLDTSTHHLRNLIADLRSRRPGDKVAVVGFSLGGLVALQALVDAEWSGDLTAEPDLVVAVASPLDGINVPVKRSICESASGVTLVGSGAAMAATGGTAGLAVGALGTLKSMQIASACPLGPVADDISWIYEHPAWRDERDRLVASATTRGVRVVTMRNTNDCVYWMTICSKSIAADDVDDRFTNAVPTATSNRWYTLPPEEWAFHIEAAHVNIMNAAFVVDDLANLIAPRPDQQTAAPPQAVASMAPPGVSRDFAFNVGPLASDVKWVQFQASSGQRITAFFSITNAGNDIDVGLWGPGGPVVPSRRYIGSGTISVVAPTTGLYTLVFDNSFSVLRSKNVELRYTIE